MWLKKIEIWTSFSFICFLINNYSVLKRKNLKTSNKQVRSTVGSTPSTFKRGEDSSRSGLFSRDLNEVKEHVSANTKPRTRGPGEWWPGRPSLTATWGSLKMHALFYLPSQCPRLWHGLQLLLPFLLLSHNPSIHYKREYKKISNIDCLVEEQLSSREFGRTRKVTKK